ncbi:MAG: nitroreductase family protein [Anaerolineae bacterium]
MSLDRQKILAMTRAIWRRVSVRSYRQEAVPAETLAEVLRAGEEAVPLWPHIPVRFVLAADADAFLREHGGTLLGYGRILGAPHFIAAISEMTAGYMENMGFRMEQMILYATALGLGTCWMGGFYSRQKVGHLVGLAKGEQVVALTPVGWPAAGGPGRLLDKTLKAFVPDRGGRKPLERLVFAGRWDAPAEQYLAQPTVLRTALEAARWAPSWRNTQPWRFVITEDALVVTTSRPAEQIGLPYYRLDAGIAMSHISLVALCAGIEPAWMLEPAKLAGLRADLAVPANYDILASLPLDARWHTPAPAEILTQEPDHAVARH